MQELLFYLGQLFTAWREKIVVSAILAVAIQLLEQFSTTFDADSFLILLLLALLVIDIFLGLLGLIKKHELSYSVVIRTTLKLPLFCLYLFLVGAVGISIDHSIHIGLPILNVFISYLIATEAFAIIQHLQLFNIKIPSLLLFMLHGFRDKIETTLRGNLPNKSYIDENKK